MHQSKHEMSWVTRCCTGRRHGRRRPQVFALQVRARWLLLELEWSSRLRVDSRSRIPTTWTHTLAGLLVKRGATVDTSNRAGQSPLLNAIYGHRRHLVAFLAEAGADPHRTDVRPVDAASFAGIPEHMRGMIEMAMKMMPEAPKPAAALETAASSDGELAGMRGITRDLSRCKCCLSRCFSYSSQTSSVIQSVGAASGLAGRLRVAAYISWIQRCGELIGRCRWGGQAAVSRCSFTHANFRSQSDYPDGATIESCGAFDPFTLCYTISHDDGRTFAVPAARIAAVEYATDMLDQCAICRAWGATRCSGCLLTAYCGPVCQRKDWKVHRGPCKAATDFLIFPRPDGPLRRYETFSRSGASSPPKALDPALAAMLEQTKASYDATLGQGKPLDIDAFMAENGIPQRTSISPSMPLGSISRGLEFDVDKLRRTLRVGADAPLGGLLKVQPESVLGAGLVRSAVLIDRWVSSKRACGKSTGAAYLCPVGMQLRGFPRLS